MFPLWLAACVGPWPAGQYDLDFTPENVKIGFVYSAPVDDGGWAQTHHEGALALADAYGAELDFVPAVANIDASTAIDDLVEGGANVIYTTSSGYISDTLDAAGEHPDTYFYSCCGNVSAENATSYFARMYQPLYLAGYAAAAKTCTGKLGVVAALDNPQFIRHINAFTLGARARAAEVGSDVTVRVEFVGAFYDPVVEAAITTRHMDAGADVILAQSNSTAPVSTDATRTVTCVDGENPTQVPVLRIAYHSPTGCGVNPENCLGAAHWNWSAFYTQQVDTLFAGTYDPTDVGWQPMLNASDTTVDFTAGDVVARDQPLVQALQRVRNEVVADPLFPFSAGVQSHDGQDGFTAGATPSDEELDRICWFVEGVEVWPQGGGDTPLDLNTVTQACTNR